MKTTVDWLRFRAKNEPLQILDALRPMCGDRAGCLHLEPGQGHSRIPTGQHDQAARYSDRSHGFWR